MKSYIADNIMKEYNKKKRQEKNSRWSKMQNFIKENCMNCENKKKDLCHISQNINSELQCMYKK